MLAFTIIGCAISALVSVFQFAVFTSFLRAAYVVPSLIDASAWIVGHKVEAFDFPYLLSQDYAGLAARCFPGGHFDRVLFGFAPWTSPIGRRGNVAVVGFDSAEIPPRSFVVDASERGRLDLSETHRDAEIGGISMRLWRMETRLATFLGAPYALVSFLDAARALGTPPDRVSFVAVHAVESRTNTLEDQIDCARKTVPEVSILGAAEFARSSAVYWLLKTGAGAAILIASLLASLLMLIILMNGISRFSQGRHRDFMSMLAIGADRRAVVNILLGIGFLLSFGSMLVALLFLPLADLGTNFLVPWVFVKPIDLAFALCVALLGAIAGSYSALTEVRQLRVADVFREG